MVREDISLYEKVLYGKIIGLTGKEGFCFASNAWLGQQLKKSNKTIERWIGNLVGKGLLRRELVYNENKQVILRRLFAFDINSNNVTQFDLPSKMRIPPLKNEGTPPLKSEGDIQDTIIQENIHITEKEKNEPTIQPVGDSQSNSIVEQEKYSEEYIKTSAKELVKHFKEVFGRTGGGPRTTERNLGYWLEEYSLEEIKQAISNAVNDSFWKKTLTLELLLRKRKATDRGEEHEYVDRIGTFLAKGAVEDNQVEQLSEQQIWDVAKEKSVSLSVVKKKSDYINKSIVSGEFSKRSRGRTPGELLAYWIDLDLSKGVIQTASEIEMLDLEDNHPKKVWARKELDRLYQEVDK